MRGRGAGQHRQQRERAGGHAAASACRFAAPAGGFRCSLHSARAVRRSACLSVRCVCGSSTPAPPRRAPRRAPAPEPSRARSRGPGAARSRRLTGPVHWPGGHLSSAAAKSAPKVWAIDVLLESGSVAEAARDRRAGGIVAGSAQQCLEDGARRRVRVLAVPPGLRNDLLEGQRGSISEHGWMLPSDRHRAPHRSLRLRRRRSVRNSIFCRKRRRTTVSSRSSPSASASR